MGTIQQHLPISQPVLPRQPMALKKGRFADATRFKGGLPLSPLSQMFYFFETKYEPGFILVSKIIGNILPRVSSTRTHEEFSEVAFNELTQTAGFFAMLPLGSAVLNPVTSAFTGVPTRLIKMSNEEALKKVTGKALQKLKVAKLGKSLGVLLFISFLQVAMPYIRNYRTIKVTGFSDYKQVVALGGKHKPTAEDLKKSDKAAKHNLNIITGLLAAGTVASLGAMGAAGALCRGGGAKLLSKAGLLKPKNLDWAMSRLALIGKNSNQVMLLSKSKIQTLWFWGIPSYIGWLMGCRDKYEVVEQLSKFGTFILGYMYMPSLMASVFKRLDSPLIKQVEKAAGRHILPEYINVPGYKNVIRDGVIPDKGLAKAFLGHLNRRNGWSLATNLIAVGILPLVFNIWFSNWRYKREHSGQAQPSAPMPITLPEPIRTRPVEKPTAPPDEPEEPDYQYPGYSASPWGQSAYPTTSSYYGYGGYGTTPYSNPYTSQGYAGYPQADYWSGQSWGQQPWGQQAAYPGYGYR